MSLGSLLSSVWERLLALPAGVKAVLGVALIGVLAVGSVLMYRTYDYVQHDNQFCLECHLMRDPFERFAQSAHRGLGCKACHRPNIVQRSEMGLAQIVEQPDSIRIHAQVPNSICAECHIEGDPEQWRRVAATAGHRIHLESDDPALEGLNCVECHSSGVHQFTPTDATCGQGGCHEGTTIRLGDMADLTIHCATCHDFATPVPEDVAPVDVASSLRPEAEECLSCHEMRAMVPQIPADEPHGAECGACHNPHTQATPRQAVESCASAGCHAMPDTLTPFHDGLDPGVMENCLTCHEAHGFRIQGDGRDCMSCHSEIYEDSPQRRASASASAGLRVAAAGPVDPGLARLALAAHPVQQAVPGDTVSFWHSQHRGVECTSCHSMQESHGALTLASIRDCRACHHTEPVAASCQDCHDPGEVRSLRGQVRRTMDLRVGSLDRPTRSLPFDHQVHSGLDCAGCHTGGLALTAANVDCSACHEEHHAATSDCSACHNEPAPGAHSLQVHLGCAGSGCHEGAPTSVQQVPRTRDFCLVCHQGMTDHRPGRNCENCHTLPSPRSGQASSAAQPAEAP
jgi:nitrate/TMAO reductase-like tetraheme cytochrome c subunit